MIWNRPIENRVVIPRPEGTMWSQVEAEAVPGMQSVTAHTPCFGSRDRPYHWRTDCLKKGLLKERWPKFLLRTIKTMKTLLVIRLPWPSRSPVFLVRIYSTGLSGLELRSKISKFAFDYFEIKHKGRASVPSRHPTRSSVLVRKSLTIVTIYFVIAIVEAQNCKRLNEKISGKMLLPNRPPQRWEMETMSDCSIPQSVKACGVASKEASLLVTKGAVRTWLM